LPSLHEVAAGLTADERQRLQAEAAAGDTLARAVVDALADCDTTISADMGTVPTSGGKA